MFGETASPWKVTVLKGEVEMAADGTHAGDVINGGAGKGEEGAARETQWGVVYVSAGVLSAMLVISFLLSLSVAQSAGTDSGKAIGIGVTAFLLFTAAATMGGAVGFLFGLPRSRFADQVAGGQSDTSGSGAATTQLPASTRFLTNSNLIKVSDWLTTIIIGLTLVNLGGILPAVGDLGAALKEPLGGAVYAGAVGVSIIVGGSVVGFLLFFMWTSIRYRQLLEDSENELERNVPNLEGMTVREAKEALGTTTLSLVPLGVPNEDAVIRTQSLNAGASVRRGSRLKVTFHTPEADHDNSTPPPPAGAAGQSHQGNGHGRDAAADYLASGGPKN